MKIKHFHPSTKSLALGLVAAAALAAGNSAQAGFLFSLTETGSGVTLTGSGSFNSGNLLFGTAGAMGSTLLPGAAIAEVGPEIPANGPAVTQPSR